MPELHNVGLYKLANGQELASQNGQYHTLENKNSRPATVRGFCLAKFITTLEKW